MKKILPFWLLFTALFFAIVLGGYFLQLNPDGVIGGLLILYFIFQGIAVRRGLQIDKNWFFSVIVVQLLFATLGPLYYSHFGDPVYEFVTGEWFMGENAFDPCQLCWWARVLMFPLLPLTLIAAFSQNKPILWYIYGASLLGILLEVFHYALQKLAIPNPFGCTDANPCSALGVEYFGFITIPFLCLMAFLVIHIAVSLLLFSKKFEKNTK